MRKQARQDSSTRDQLLDAALQLMLTKGFTATSVEEICTAAGVTKGSFFHYFRSKDDLGQAVLYHYWRPLKQLLAEAPFHRINDPLARVYAYCDFIAALFDDPRTPTSCLFGNLTQELANTHPAIRTTCDAAFTWWAESFATDLALAKQQYAPDASFDPAAVAAHFVAIYEGALILAKARQDAAVIKTHLAQFKRYVELLFAHAQAPSVIQQQEDAHGDRA